MTTPNITVSVDTSASTYELVTDPYVKPPDEPLLVDRLGELTIKAGGAHSDITVVATLPSTATETTPFAPELEPVTTTTATYQLTAIGKVTLTVPTYGNRPLTGEPLTLSPAVTLTLSTANPATPPISFGATVTLVVPDIDQAQQVDCPDGLFVGFGAYVMVEPGGSAFTISDFNDGSYEVGTPADTNQKMTIPLVGTINVSSTKKPHL